VTQANTIMSSFSTNLASLMTADRILNQVRVIDLTSPIGGEGISTSAPVPGTRPGGVLPASTAVLQSQEVLRRYRGGHPRTYWPFGSDDDLADANTWFAAFVNTVHAALVAHFTDWSTDLVPGLVSVVNVNISYYEGFTVFTGPTGRMSNRNKPRPIPVIDLIVSTIVRESIAAITRRILPAVLP
jgi:hypothetical protein